MKTTITSTSRRSFLTTVGAAAVGPFIVPRQVFGANALLKRPPMRAPWKMG